MIEPASVEAQLREAKALAEAADHAKSAFLAAMSHELRTPLTAIIGFSELLEDGTGGPLTDRQRKYVNNILTSGRSLLDLIDQVLDIARVEVGRLALALTPLEMGELLEDMAMLVRPLASKKQVALEVVLDAGLLKITADAPKVKQVVFGLLANAVLRTPEGGTVRLQARTRNDVDGPLGEWIEIAVQNSGARIAAEHREKLLKDFSIGEAGAIASRPEVGVSLPLARKLIELHGGVLWLEDGDDGAGSAVKFLLPQAARPIGARVSPALPMHVPDEDADKPMVLVVEDDLQASDLLTHYIEEGGYRVARAYTCAQALAMAGRLVPFAMTIDAALPDGDGLDLLASMRANKGLDTVPAVVISVTGPREDVSRLGAVAWIVKPVNRAELLGVLRRQHGPGARHDHRVEQR